KLKSKNWSKNEIIQVFKYFEFIYRVIKRYKTSDILHCNDLNTLPIGVIIKKFFNKNVRIVYDAHEYEINDIPYENKYKIKMKYFIEKYLIKHADTVICVSDKIADEYVRLYKIEKPDLVLNTPHYINLDKKNIFRETFGIDENKTIFLYQGALTLGRGIEVLLQTFKEINNDKYIIVFMGYGILEESIMRSSKKYKNIYFHKAVPSDILLNYTSSADFGISTIEDSCLSYRYCLPNKMFEYIMADVPVIVSNLIEMKKIVNYYNVGIVVKNNTLDGVIDAVQNAQKLNKEEIQKNIQIVKEIYNWEEQEKVLLKLYERLY
ncbi:MAG: glycosyl transferase family 1, partial [Epsilonproteobacteria bacterium]